ncbi:MAG: aldo/keto reductase [Dehalococcoidia bacterium]|nr:aldo/keto reductase [Dehalococcoidia bacterium]
MPDLPTRTLGRTGLPVTTLGFGALELRGMVAGVGRPLSSGQPAAILNAVLDAGINYIDTAVDYGYAEEHIGRHIAHRRSEFYLASKCGCPLDNAGFQPEERTRFGVPLPRFHDYSRESIVNACHQSLRRMRTDYLDIVQFHFSPAREVLEQEGAIETLQDLQRQGKIRYLGCSSILPNIFDHIAMDVFDVLQVPYSILQPEHSEAIERAASAGLGIVIRGGVARGQPGAGQGTAQVWDRWEQAELDDLLEGMTATEFLLRATISNPHVHTTIVGTLNPAHLQENVAAVRQGPLSATVIEEAKRRLDFVPDEQ